MEKVSVKKVVLAYSGGLDTSVIVSWLRENYDCEVICFTADIGQGEETADLPARAKASGASKLIQYDLREEFASEYLFPLVRSGAIYERKYLLGTSVARPLIAKYQVQVAEQEGADAVAHGCTGKGNDQVRFELTYTALNPRLKIIAPWREWNIRSREDAVNYLKSHGYAVPTSSGSSLYSRDRNLWHLSHEGGPLENANKRPKMRCSNFPSRRSKRRTSRNRSTLDVRVRQPGGGERQKAFARPDRRDAQPDRRQARHRASGFGREPAGGHEVARRVRDARRHDPVRRPPGIGSLTLDRDTLHYKDIVAQRYAELVYFGQWFTPLREAMDAFFATTQRTVTGSITLKLYKGNLIVAGRTSPYSLYREDIATFGYSEIYSHSDAAGFIQLWGLPLKIRALIEQGAQDVPPVPAEKIIRD